MGNNSWLIRLLQEHYNTTSVMILEEQGAESGSLSDIQRIKAEITVTSGQKKTISLIVKKMNNETESQMQKDFFQLELKIYTEVFPKIDIISEEEKLWPEFYGYNDDPLQFALQDLKELGYDLAENKTDLDSDHALLTVSCLGRFHALSALYLDSLPNNLPQHSPFASKTSPLITAQFRNGLKTLSEVIINLWDEEWKSVGESIHQISENISEIIHNTSQVSLGKYNALNHGDPWANNILFSYSHTESVPQNLKFVDFQMSFVNSFAWDLTYFIYLNVDLSYRLKNMKKLLEAYQKSLEDVIVARGGSPTLVPSLAEVQVLTDSLHHFALILTCVSYIELECACNEDFVNFNPEGMSKFYKKEWYNRPEIKERLSKELTYFVSKGIFNNK